jgi:hypothetical protein
VQAAVPVRQWRDPGCHRECDLRAANVLGLRREITIFLVPGETPLLIARTCLEDWSIILDLRDKRMQMLDRPDKGWIDAETSEKGHYLLDLLTGETHGDDSYLASEVNAVNQDAINGGSDCHANNGQVAGSSANACYVANKEQVAASSVFARCDDDDGPPQLADESSSATDSSSDKDDDDSDDEDDYEVNDEQGTLRYEFVKFLTSVSEKFGHDAFYKEMAENKMDFVMSGPTTSTPP